MQNKGSELPKEHILVCLSSSPSNERIIRMAGKMAQAFSGSLTALYVQTPGDADMNAEDTVRLQANMRLAQQLGAEIVTTHGEDVATQIAEYVRLSNVTKIVIGRSGVQRRHFWSEATLTERLIALAPEVDIHIIPDVEAYKSYRRKRLLPIVRRFRPHGNCFGPSGFWQLRRSSDGSFCGVGLQMPISSWFICWVCF